MSATPKKLTLYTAGICPYAQRVAIALQEVGAVYESVEIDLANKPEWYKDINPETKVPALSIDGKNIAESLVLLELVADLYPEKGLLPKDPIKRAEVRFVIEFFASKVASQQYALLSNFNEESAQKFKENVNAAYKRLNQLLLEQAPSGPYFLGSEYSLADIAIAPFAARLGAVQKFLLNGYVPEAVGESPRLAEFLKGIVSRPTFEKTYVGDKTFAELVAKRYNLPLPSL